MELLKEYTFERYGNECLIKDYIYLIRLDYDVYLVTRTTAITGSWTGNPITTYCDHFRDLADALVAWEEFVRNLKEL